MGCWRFVSADQTDYAPRPMRVSCWDVLSLCFAIIFHIFDLYTDVKVTLHYYDKGEPYYAIATIVIILIPSVVTSCVSYRMYTMDIENKISYTWNFKMKLRLVMLLLQLAPMLRYIDSLKYAYKSWKAEQQNKKDQQEKYYILMLKEDADVALLRVFESFLEAAPQQVLQISYLLKSYYQERPVDLGFTGYDPVISAASSFIGMAFCLLTYQKSIRFVQEDKDNINWKGSLFIFLWHFFVTISRILMLSAMVYIFWIYALSSMVVHWILMTVFLSLVESPKFCSSSSSIKLQKCNIFDSFANFLFSSVLGLVFIFTYITPGEGSTCFRYFFYYGICLLENIGGAAFWYNYMDTNWLTILITVMCVLPFVLGCLCMITYYCKFHPKEYTPPSIIPQRREIQAPGTECDQLGGTPSAKSQTEEGKGQNGTVPCEIGQGDDLQTEMECCISEKL